MMSYDWKTPTNNWTMVSLFVIASHSLRVFSIFGTPSNPSHSKPAKFLSENIGFGKFWYNFHIVLGLKLRNIQKLHFWEDLQPGTTCHRRFVRINPTPSRATSGDPVDETCDQCPFPMAWHDYRGTER
jgi:hypothetical protein